MIYATTLALAVVLSVCWWSHSRTTRARQRALDTYAQREMARR